MAFSLKRWQWMAALCAGVTCASVSGAVAAENDPWDVGSNWMYVRAGIARNAADGAGNSGAGYGIGFRHMLTASKVNDWKILGRKPLGFVHWTLFRHWSIGAFAEYDVLGRYGNAADIEIPAALELTRHSRWKSAAKPYLTLGMGPFFRKTYRTGADFSRVDMSAFVSTGFDAPIAPNQLLGFDVRLARVQSANTPVNPVFGPGQNEATHWSAKLSYAIHY